MVRFARVMLSGRAALDPTYGVECLLPPAKILERSQYNR